MLLDGTCVPGTFSVQCRWLTRSFALGGMIGTGANVAALRRANVTHVINLQQEFDDTSILRDSGIRLCWLPVTDSLSPFPEDAVQRAIGFFRAAARLPHHRVYIHCMSGKNRAPLFAYAILRAMGWADDAAITAIRGAEPAALLRREHLDAVERCLARGVMTRHEDAESSPAEARTGVE